MYSFDFLWVPCFSGHRSFAQTTYSFFVELPDIWCSVAQSCPILYDLMDCNKPGFPVLHYLPEFAETHVHWVGEAIQPSYPLSSPSPPAFSLSQHQGLFHESVLHIRWPKYCSFSFNTFQFNIIRNLIIPLWCESAGSTSHGGELLSSSLWFLIVNWFPLIRYLWEFLEAWVEMTLFQIRFVSGFCLLLGRQPTWEHFKFWAWRFLDPIERIKSMWTHVNVSPSVLGESKSCLQDRDRQVSLLHTLPLPNFPLYRWQVYFSVIHTPPPKGSSGSNPSRNILRQTSSHPRIPAFILSLVSMISLLLCQLAIYLVDDLLTFYNIFVVSIRLFK